MNKTHRIVWSESRQAFIVVHENAATRGKPSSTKRVIVQSVTAAVLVFGAGQAMAAACADNPIAGVVAGPCSLSAGASLNVGSGGSITPGTAVTSGFGGTLGVEVAAGATANSINNALGGTIGASTGTSYIRAIGIEGAVTGGITNSGSIVGTFMGVELSGASATLTNSGGIAIYNDGVIKSTSASTYASGIAADQGAIINGNIVNALAGTISGGFTGILLLGSAMNGNISNSGTISGGSNGINAKGVGSTITTIFNDTNGVISGSGTAGLNIVDHSIVNSIINNGTITGGRGILITAATISSGITNSGALSLIGGNVDGIRLNSGGIVAGGIINEGQISGGSNGISVQNGTVTGGINNSGTIHSGSTAAIFVSGSQGSIGGGITNSGLISGNTHGIYVDNNAAITGGITNSGTLSVISGGENGIKVNSGGVVTGGITNEGQISGTSKGISIRMGTITGGVNNSGTIHGADTAAVWVWGANGSIGGGITNSGLISGGPKGIQVSNSALVTDGITNSGTASAITADSNAIYLGYGGTLNGGIINQGTISGGGRGILVDNNALITDGITNSGTASAITGAATNGIAIGTGGKVTGGLINEGTISGALNGVYVYGANSTLSGGINNSGTIAGGNAGSSAGIYVRLNAVLNGGVTNSGLISGDRGILVSNAALLSGGIHNSGGTIAGRIGIDVSNSATLTNGITNSGMIMGSFFGIALGQSSDITGGITNQAGGRIFSTSGAGPGPIAMMLNGLTRVDVLNEGTSASSRGTIVGAINGNANVTNNGLWAIQQGTTVGGAVAGSTQSSTISGNFVQGSNGVLQVGAAGTGANQYSKLSVGGTATIAGTIHVDVASAFDNAANAGGTLSGVVTATGGLTANSLSVTDSSVLLSFGYLASANVLDLCVTLEGSTCGSGGGGGGGGGGSNPILASVTAVGNAPATGAANVLDPLLAGYIANGTTGNAGMDVVMAQLVLDSGTNQQVSDDVSETLPLLTGGQSQAMGNALHGVNRIVQSRQEGQHGRSSGDQFFGDEHLWFKPFGSWANQDNRKGVSGYDANTYGMVFGMDGEISETNRIGAAFAYARSDVESNSHVARQSADVDTYQLVVYGSHSLSPETELSYQADYGRHNTEGQRRIAFVGSTAKSDYDSWSAHAGVGLAHTYSFSDKTSLTPTIRADYALIDSESYTEKNAGALNLKVNDSRVEELILSVDGKLAHALSDKATLTANLGVGYDVINEKASITSAYAGASTASFVTKGLDPSPWLARAGLGIVGKVSDRLEVTARYDAEIRQDFDNQTASVKFRWAF